MNDDINIEDLCKQVEDHEWVKDIHRWANERVNGYVINIESVNIYGDDSGQCLRAVYWVLPGEFRFYDIDYSKYKEEVRDRKLKELGI